MKSKPPRLLIALIALCVNARAAPGPPTEGQLKAAFAYNFIALAPWDPSIEKIDFCILGNSRIRRELEQLSGRAVGTNRTLSTRQATPDTVGACHAVFVSADQASQLERLLGSLRGKKTLTIGDSPGFGRRGVMFNLVVKDDRVRFEANSVAATEAGLPISSRLLALATAVFEAPSERR